MKTFFSFIFFLFGGASLASAQLTIDNCQQMARENYPLIKKYQLIEQTAAYNLSNAAKAWLPQFQLNVRATYQSDVTRIPLDLSQLSAIGMQIPEMPIPTKDQYQATVEVGQVLWDGGAIRAQQRLTKAGSEVERKQLEVELYTLEERVNQLFFGILLLNEQLTQNQLLTDELGRNFTMIKNYMENGVANQSDLDVVKVEQLNAKQMRTQLQSARKAFAEMLGIMIGKTIDENAGFINTYFIAIAFR